MSKSSIEHTLFFDAAGPRSAPAVLFVHGVTSSRMWWLPQLHALSDSYRVLALDLPGHGTLKEEPFSIERSVELIAHVVQETERKQVVLAGVSLGAYITIAAAAKHPELVTGLVLSGCSANPGVGIWPPLLRAAARLLEWTRPIAKPIIFRIAHTMLRSLPQHTTRRIIEAGGAFDNWPVALRELATLDTYALLRQFEGPVLVIDGRYGMLRPFQPGLLAAIKDVTVQVVDGATHGPNIERPELYTATLRRFLQRLSDSVTSS